MLRLITLMILAGVATTQPRPFTPFELPRGSTIMDVAFTGDNRTMYATLVSATQRYTIVEAHYHGERWSAPKPVSFSGTWRDLEEVLAPDASYMIFASNRPIVPGGKPLDAFYAGRYSPKRGGNLWIVRRTPDGWGTPQRLPDAINANTSTFSPAVAADGTLYFMRATGPGGHFHLFVSHPEGGTYADAQPATFADSRYGEFDPTVAADDSVVIFSSTRAPVPHGTDHLFIAVRRNGEWSTPRDLGLPINAGGHDVEARLSPNAKQLYYSTSGTVLFVDLR